MTTETPPGLDPDDVELLVLLATGSQLEVVARRLGLSERTIRRRIRRICDRLGVGTAMEAVVWATRQGVI